MPTPCLQYAAAHQGQLCADSALCKLGRLTQPAEILCCGAARGSCRSLRLRGFGTGELTQADGVAISKVEPCVRFRCSAFML